MDVSILENIGLTNAEIKVYLALLELGTSTAGPIIQKTGLQNSVTHMTLHKLVEKGFISFILKGKTKHYQASDPRNILNFIEDKKKSFEKILPELMIKRLNKVPQEAEIYEGFQGFKNMLYELIKDGKKGDEYLFFTFYTEDAEMMEKVHNFYREFEKVRKDRGLIIKGIAYESMRKQFTNRDMSTLLFVDFPTPNNVTIFNDAIAFSPLSDGQYMSFLIRSKNLADSFRNYFYSIWNKYKKNSNHHKISK
jgi:HTH-type transcriptional regulator, sugar sensing transcriptional regulator